MARSRSETSSPNVSFERERGVYGLTVTRDLAHVAVHTDDDAWRTERILEVFRLLAGADVPVFLIKMHRTRVTMAMASADVERASQALKAMGIKVTLRRDLALVAVRAASMRDLHGVIIAIADALFEAGAQIMEIGDSHDSVQCLLEAEKLPQAVSCLQEKFHLESSSVVERSLDAEDMP